MLNEPAAHRRRVLVVLSHYLPGFRAGGPVRSIEGLADQLGDELDLFILTLDRDIGDSTAYPGVEAGIWQRVGAGMVMYVTTTLGPFRFLRILTSLAPDIIYLNTLFSVKLTVVPLLCNRRCRPRALVVLAPRGQLSGAALRLKSWKKTPFLTFLRHSRLLNNVTWQASTLLEAADIHAALGARVRVVVAANLQRPLPGTRPPIVKSPGLLRAVFVSRISPKKNLLYLLNIMMFVRGRVDLDIIGPPEDQQYWNQCVEHIAALPTDVVVTYHGDMTHDLVGHQLAAHDLLILPTLNENFGHIILESLSVGTPVLISDQTPWRNLTSDGAGWDLDLKCPEEFIAVVELCINMGAEQFAKHSAAAVARAQRWFHAPEALEANRKLFVEPRP